MLPQILGHDCGSEVVAQGVTVLPQSFGGVSLVDSGDVLAQCVARDCGNQGDFPVVDDREFSQTPPVIVHKSPVGLLQEGVEAYSRSSLIGNYTSDLVHSSVDTSGGGGLVFQAERGIYPPPVGQGAGNPRSVAENGVFVAEFSAPAGRGGGPPAPQLPHR